MAERLKRLTLDDQESAKLCTLQAVVKGIILRRQLAELRRDYEELTFSLEKQHSNQSIVEWHSEHPCKPHHYIKKYSKKRPVMQNKSSETKCKPNGDCKDVRKQEKHNEKTLEERSIDEGNNETCVIPERVMTVTKGEEKYVVSELHVPEKCLQTDEINSDIGIRAYEDEAPVSERSDTAASLESVNRTDVLPIMDTALNEEAQLTDSSQTDGGIQAPDKENFKKEIKLNEDQLIQNDNDQMRNPLEEYDNTIPAGIQHEVDMDTNNTDTFEVKQLNFTDTFEDINDKNTPSTGSSKRTEDAYATPSDHSISDKSEQSSIVQGKKENTEQNTEVGDGCTDLIDGSLEVDGPSKTYHPEDKADVQVSRCGIHDETSVWGSELSFRGSKNYPTDPEELKKLRNHVAMEMLWVQQAIISRKNYLRLKGKMDCKSSV